MMLRELPTTVTIRPGHHSDCDGTHGCVMDLVSWTCGYAQITDHPECASAVLTEYAITLNDAMPDDETRTRLLLPLVARLAGSRSSPAVERQRMFLLVDRAVRVFAPLALDATNASDAAEKLRRRSPIMDMSSARSAAGAAEAAEAAAWAAGAAEAAGAEAARAAAEAAARAAAWELAAQALSDALDIADAVV